MQPSSRLQSILDDAVASSGVAGAQVSLILGADRADLVAGTANAELKMPMTADTVVQVGSVCKVFNAALIMTLVEDGALVLDAPVVEYLPEIELADRAARDAITLRHLLSMSSGLDNGPYSEPTTGREALGRYVGLLHEVPQIFPPGTAFGYSNAGTCIAGYAAERVTGERWDDLMRKRIFEPAGLAHALTLPEELPFHRVSVGHTGAQDGQPAKVTRPWYINQAMGPAGSTLTMSAHDLARFGQIFVNGGMTAQGRRVLSQDSVKIMMTPTTAVPVSSPLALVGSHWGLGPSMDHWDDTTVWGHAGGNMSGTSRLLWFPQLRGVLAVAFNTGSNSAFGTSILRELSKAVFGVGAPARDVPASSARVENPERFVGCYERYGTQIEIVEDSERLLLRETSLGTGKRGEQLGVVYDTALIPLGGDRFVCETPGRGSLPILPSHTAVGFSGDDGRGCAALVISPFLAARRVR
jgi:CubicO group peptidase (beta-lactamase class C family)